MSPSGFRQAVLLRVAYGGPIQDSADFFGLMLPFARGNAGAGGDYAASPSGSCSCRHSVNLPLRIV